LKRVVDAYEKYENSIILEYNIPLSVAKVLHLQDEKEKLS